MRPLAEAVTGMDRSPIRDILDRAACLPDAIHLEIGQPDFATPPHIVEAAVQAARQEYTGYTANSGMLSLREAVVTKLARENGIRVTPNHVVVTIGAMEAVFASMAVLLDPGDEVLLPDPGYGNFTMASRLVHARAVAYPTLAQEGFIPDLDALDALVTPRTKALFVNSPSNPTGAVFPEWVLRECLAFCRRHDLYLISDETYDRLVFEGAHVSPAQWDDEGRVITIFTTSKTYSMTGWRVGYAVMAPRIAAAMSKIQEPLVSCVNTIAQHAAAAALVGPQDCVQQMLAEYHRRRDLAVRLAGEYDLGVSYPHGAFYMLVDISAQPLDSVTFSRTLLHAEHLAVAPGVAFGQRADGYVRLSLCASADNLERGIPRLARFLHDPLALMPACATDRMSA
jgi:aspartate aminotransferase/aminotransferase